MIILGSSYIPSLPLLQGGGPPKGYLRCSPNNALSTNPTTFDMAFVTLCYCGGTTLTGDTLLQGKASVHRLSDY